MLDQAQVRPRENVFFDGTASVEPAYTQSEFRATNASRFISETNVRDLLGVDDQPRVRRPKVAFKFRLDRSQFAERRRHFSQDPGRGEIRRKEAERSFAAERAAELDIEQDEVEDRLGDVRAGTPWWKLISKLNQLSAVCGLTREPTESRRSD